MTTSSHFSQILGNVIVRLVLYGNGCTTLPMNQWQGFHKTGKEG